MMDRKPAIDNLQPRIFEFNEDNLEIAKNYIKKYPQGKQQSAVLPLLHLAQKQQGWVPIKAMHYIASLLDMPYIRVYEVASFYTMFNLKPVGKYHIQLCGTTPCWLRGSDNLKKICKDKIGINIGETSSDGNFTLSEVECLGACANGPMVQINDDYFEDLDKDNFTNLLDKLQRGEQVTVGSQIGRVSSEPLNYKNNQNSEGK
jgi:NADH dehydrogenase (ubiquinone) flavoprotein 2